MARVLITGVAGQDGSYLAELLVSGSTQVIGVVRDLGRARLALGEIERRLTLVEADLSDPEALPRLVADHQPDEVYHLAAPTFVPASWDDPVGVTRFAALGTVALLEAARRAPAQPRIVLASSSEVFGSPGVSPQDERAPLAPITPYGAAKAHALLVGDVFRRRYGLHVCSAILYNHESPRRPERFVTRKVTRAAAAISLGLEHDLVLGSLDASRDWGWAPDYVRALVAMARADEPGDFVIATGQLHTVGELVERAFARVGLDWSQHVTCAESFVRGGVDAARLVGDARRARERLGWTPQVQFGELVDRMVDADLQALRATLDPAGGA